MTKLVICPKQGQFGQKCPICNVAKQNSYSEHNYEIPELTGFILKSQVQVKSIYFITSHTIIIIVH